MYFQEPEPSPRYEDMPPWHPDDNFDNVRKRAINAGWHLLMTRDLGRLRFSEISKLSSVTPAAIYHHFKDLDGLGRTLAVYSAVKLRNECNAALRGTKSVSRYLRALLAFAARRPNHFALLTGVRLAEDPEVMEARRGISADLDAILSRLLRRDPTRSERAAMHIQIFGGAAMVAARVAAPSDVLSTLVATIKSWRRATRRKAAEAP